jgi:hypothetical protein
LASRELFMASTLSYTKEYFHIFFCSQKNSPDCLPSKHNGTKFMKIHQSEIKQAPIWSVLICMVTKRGRRCGRKQRTGSEYVGRGGRDPPSSGFKEITIQFVAKQRIMQGGVDSHSVFLRLRV